MQNNFNYSVSVVALSSLSTEHALIAWGMSFLLFSGPRQGTPCLAAATRTYSALTTIARNMPCTEGGTMKQKSSRSSIHMCVTAPYNSTHLVPQFFSSVFRPRKQNGFQDLLHGNPPRWSFHTHRHKLHLAATQHCTYSHSCLLFFTELAPATVLVSHSRCSSFQLSM